MKLLICTLLMLAINEITCAPSEDDDSGSSGAYYGVGFEAGGSYKGGLEVGVNAKDDSRSVFLNKNAAGKVHASAGFTKPVTPAPSNISPNNGVPMQNGPYPVPLNNVYSMHPVPPYNVYPIPNGAYRVQPYNGYYGYSIQNEGMSLCSGTAKEYGPYAAICKPYL